jgi:hypothetical protein
VSLRRKVSFCLKLEKEENTHCGLDFAPADVLPGLELGWVVTEDAVLQDLRLSLAEVSDPEERDGLGA